MTNENMTIGETKQFVKDRLGSLNVGETLGDALDHLKNGTPRIGYAKGRDKNHTIQMANKEAFRKSFTPAVYVRQDVESIDDIVGDNDLRSDKEQRGVVMKCFYCGVPIRVDVDEVNNGQDYYDEDERVHCEGCMSDAIMRLAM